MYLNELDVYKAEHKLLNDMIEWCATDANDGTVGWYIQGMVDAINTILEAIENPEN